MGKLLVAGIFVIAVLAMSYTLGFVVVSMGKAYMAYKAGLVECINRVDHTEVLDLPIRVTLCRAHDTVDEPWSDWRVINARKGFVGHIYILDGNLPD